MEPIRIGGNKEKDQIKNMLDKYFFNSKVKIQEEDYEKRFDFLFHLGKKKSVDEIAFYDSLANLIQDIIVNIYVTNIMEERINKICLEYTSGEKREISRLTHEVLKNKDYYSIEREQIKKDLVDYLIENNNIYIDGYMKFRLRDYLYLVDISIEKAIFELESEKEYEEFLGILQYFVDIQESSVGLVNVIIKDNDYILLDSEDQILEDGILNEIEEDLYYEDISKADLLMSSLIVMSPERLIVHIDEGEEEDLVAVLEEVFRDKVSFCHKCEKCKLDLKLKKGK